MKVESSLADAGSAGFAHAEGHGPVVTKLEGSAAQDQFAQLSAQLSKIEEQVGSSGQPSLESLLGGAISGALGGLLGGGATGSGDAGSGDAGGGDLGLGSLAGAFGGGDGTHSPLDTDPLQNPLGSEGSQGAASTATTSQISGDNFSNGIAALQSKDPEAFDRFQKDVNDGDGNAMVKDLAKDFTSGDLTKDEANALATEAQQIANANGGGKINKKARNEFKEALGNSDDVITNGHTRGADFWKEHGAQLLSGIGGAAGGVASMIPVK